MSKRKYILLIIAVILVGLIITGASYAFWSITSDNKSLTFNTAGNLKKYINYDNGNGIFSGTLQVGNSYSTGIHTTIAVSKKQAASNVALTGTIYLDVNAIGNNMKNSSALKWAVTSGTSSPAGTLLASGNFMGTSSGDTITLYPSFTVTTTPENYTIWIWLDEAEYPSEALSGETLDTNVWTEITQVEGVNEQFDITQINANYQIITATVVNNMHDINAYAVTTSATEPSSWTQIANPAKIYNLPPYSNTVVGQSYYVWFKDTEGHTKRSQTALTISASDTTPPTCTWGTFNPNSIGNEETATISLTCTDSGSGIVNSNIKTTDITATNNKVSVSNISKTTTTNGYIYTITITGISDVDGTDSLTLAANTIKDATKNGNISSTSGNITIQDLISPTIEVSVTNGTTYAKSNTVSVTISDNNELAAGSYTIKYGWSTTAKTCNELTDTVILNVASGENTKTATVTISGETGPGNIYVCNQTAITDAGGNSVAANTLQSTEMYLDNTGPTATVALEVQSTLAINVTLTDIQDDYTSVKTPYYYDLSTNSTCSDATYLDSSNNSYNLTGVTDAGTYYACIKLYDILDNESIIIREIKIGAYLTDLSNVSSYFKEEAYRDKITKIEVVNQIDLTNAISGKEPYLLDSYNSGMIKGWLEQNDVTNNTYDLYIGANSTIYARGSNLSNAFYNMRNVSNISLGNLNTSEATDMPYMFSKAGTSATNFSLDLGNNFNTSNVNTMANMFSNTGYSATNSNVDNMAYMFYFTGHSATNFSLDLGNNFNTSNVNTMMSMFSRAGDESTTFSLDLGNNFNTSNVDNMAFMFSYVGRAATNFSLDLGNHFNTSNVNTMAYMFYFTGHSATNFSLDLGNNFNTSNVNTMANMFSNTGYSATNFSLDLGNHFNTSNVDNMTFMFSDAGGGSTNFSLDLGNSFNTSNVNTMASMFFNTGQAATNFTLNLGNNFNTSNVDNMASMFSNAGRAATTFSLDLGNSFNTSNVNTMAYMFSNTGRAATNFTLDLEI